MLICLELDVLTTDYLLTSAKARMKHLDFVALTLTACITASLLGHANTRAFDKMVGDKDSKETDSGSHRGTEQV